MQYHVCFSDPSINVLISSVTCECHSKVLELLCLVWGIATYLQCAQVWVSEEI